MIAFQAYRSQQYQTTSAKIEKKVSRELETAIKIIDVSMTTLSNKQMTNRFNRCLVFFNPTSTNATTAVQRIDELKSLLAHCTIETIESSPKGRQANRALLEKHAAMLGPRTLLCIAGGDGTTNQIIEALITSKQLTDKQRSTPILPLWCGNANDLAHMLNGSNRTPLNDILTNGHIVAIHPLECNMTTKGKTVITRIAACYAGFGATAFAALRLSQATHRKSKLHALPGGRPLQEVITIASALLATPAFAVKDAENVQVVYERIFANGSRMAKLVRLPIELTDEMFYINTLERKRLFSIFPHLVELLLRRVSAKFLRSHDHFTIQEQSWAHFDGEALEIPAKTDVDVQLSARPFYALSTLLTTGKG